MGWKKNHITCPVKYTQHMHTISHLVAVGSFLTAVAENTGSFFYCWDKLVMKNVDNFESTGANQYFNLFLHFWHKQVIVQFTQADLLLFNPKVKTDLLTQNYQNDIVDKESTVPTAESVPVQLTPEAKPMLHIFWTDSGALGKQTRTHTHTNI